MNDCSYLLPAEADEMTQQDVKRLRSLEQRLRQVFAQAEYEEVMPATFEYVDLYRAVDSEIDQEKLFQFINHEGRPIALRYDFTIPLARAYATTGKTEPARYAYYGKVFRKEKRNKGRRTEAYQVGVELMGADEPQGDLATFTLVQSVIERLRLTNVVIDLGSASYYRRILALDTGTGQRLAQLLAKKNLSGLHQYVAQNQFAPALAELIEALPIVHDLEQLMVLTEATGDTELIASLRKLVVLVANEQSQFQINFDLALAPTMSYYTGVMFQVYGQGAAQPIISGGRYDDLLAKFGPQTGAIGFCCHMDELLKVITGEGADA